MNFSPLCLYKLCYSRLVLRNYKPLTSKISYKVQKSSILICINSLLYFDMDFASTPHCGAQFKGHEDVVCLKTFWLLS